MDLHHVYLGKDTLISTELKEIAVFLPGAEYSTANLAKYEYLVLSTHSLCTAI